MGAGRTGISMSDGRLYISRHSSGKKKSHIGSKLNIRIGGVGGDCRSQGAQGEVRERDEHW